jgi:protein-tyrosine phosphatase
VAAYLMKKKGMRFEDIVTLFLDKRPIIYMSPIFIKELKEIK